MTTFGVLKVQFFTSTVPIFIVSVELEPVLFLSPTFLPRPSVTKCLTIYNTSPLLPSRIGLLYGKILS